MSKPRRTELSEGERGRILALYEENYKYREIAARLSISPSTVGKTVSRYKKHGTYKSLPRSGRPVAVSPRTRRLIIRKLLMHRWECYRDIASRISGVTRRQVQKVANQEGFHRCVACTKPALTPAMRSNRVVWADSNAGRNWNSVIWTDECSIETGERPGRRRVTRRPGEEYLPECVASTHRSGRQSIMVWGAIAHGVKGPLIRLETAPHGTGKGGRRTGGASAKNT